MSNEFEQWKQRAEKADAEIARLENIVTIQQKQIERMLDARDIEKQRAEKAEAAYAEMRSVLEHWKRHHQANIPTNQDEQEASGEDFTACWHETEHALSSDCGNTSDHLMTQIRKSVRDGGNCPLEY